MQFTAIAPNDYWRGQLTKTWRIMRIISFLFLICCLQVAATGTSQTITFSGKNISLEKLFDVVEKQTGYSFVFNINQVRSSGPITVDAKQVELRTFLTQILQDQELGYEINETTITVGKKRYPTGSLSSRLGEPHFSATLAPPITGRITDTEGNPLSGVSVTIKGTQTGATTDANGNFSIGAAHGNILIISAVGYKTEEVKISSESIQLSLVIAESKLDEVLIQAYGITSRRLNTGNIARVGAEEIGRQPVNNPLSALEGKVTGLMITQTTGLAGGAIKVELRGRTAIDRNLTDDQPLFIIDGVPFGANNNWLSSMGSALGQPNQIYTVSEQGGISPFSSIPPQDIESIEVLKDADATAIYGSRGANGVILITTKKGRAGKTKVNANVYAGTSKLANPVKMMNMEQYLSMRNRALANDGLAPTNGNAYDLTVWDTTRNTNFAQLLAGNSAKAQDAQLSLSGGSAQTQFLVSGSFRKETAIIPGDFFTKKQGVHFHINHTSLNRKFTIVFSGSYNSDNNNLTLFEPLRNILNLPPNHRVYTDAGALQWNEGGYLVDNPLAFTKQPYSYNNDILQGNMQINYSIFSNLIFRTNVGYNQNQLEENSKNPIAAQNPLYPAFLLTRSTNTNQSRVNSRIIEPQLEYHFNLGGEKLTILTGGSWQDSENKGTAIASSGYSSDDFMSSIATATSHIPSNWNAKYRYQAVFGRVNYNWQQKYLVNLSARRDGSSRFGDGKQFANFGAVGGAWIFSNENWIKGKSPKISFGKVRGSYGITGNDKISDYQYLDTWKATTLYAGGGGLYPNKLFNPDYRWEKTIKLEGALDLGFFNDRLLFSAAYYHNTSSNQLVNYKLPSITGFNGVVANLPAKVRNTGWELSLSYSVIKKSNFRWELSGNITVPKNKLVSFPDIKNSSYASTYEEGEPLNIVKVLDYTGLNSQTGLFEFGDADRNNVITINDRKNIVSLDPKAFGGLQSSFHYKGIDVDILLSFRKQTGRNYLYSIGQMPGNMRYNLPAAMTNFWTKPGDEAEFQRLSTNSSEVYTGWANFSSSTGVYSDASFMRLRNIAVSYTLPQHWHKKLNIDRCRLYFQGQNLLTFSRYNVGDPETQFITRVPPLRALTFGMEISL